MTARAADRSVTRDVSTLALGTVLAQGITVLIAPVLSRLYTPADFGAFAFFIAVVGILAVAAGGRYEFALMLPPDTREAAATARAASLLALASVTLTAVVVFVGGPRLATAMGMPQLVPTVGWLPLALLAAVLFELGTYWSIRRRRYRAVASARLGQAGIAAGVQTAIAALGTATPAGLIGGHIAGQVVPAIALGGLALRRDPALRATTMVETREAARRYRKFPFLQAPINLLNTTSMQVPQLLLAGLFGPGATGLYAMAVRVFAGPLQIVGQASSQVLFERFAAGHRRQEDLRPLIRRSYGTLLLLGLGPLLVVLIWGPDLVGLVFGANWREAGHYLRVLAPWLLAMFVVSPSTTVFSVHERQEELLLFEIVLLTARTGALLGVGALTGSAVGALAGFGAVGVVANLYIGHRVLQVAAPRATPAAPGVP